MPSQSADRISSLCALGVVLFLAAILSEVPLPAGELELRWNAATLYERSVTSRVVLSRDGTSLELQRGVLYEDDGPAVGYSYRPNAEPLGSGVRIRKRLLISHPRRIARY